MNNRSFVSIVILFQLLKFPVLLNMTNKWPEGQFVMLDDGLGMELVLVSMLVRVASMQRIRRMENSYESKEDSCIY